jgi:acyl-CoA thioesterase I
MRTASKHLLIVALAVGLAVWLSACDDGKSVGPDVSDDGQAIEWTAENSIVCLGTSLTYGYGSGCKRLPPPASCDADSAYPALLQKRLRLPLVNMGAPLSTSGGGLGRLERVFDHDPALVILEFGGNDLIRGVEVATARANMIAMIETIRRRGVRVALLGFLHPDMIPLTPPGHRLERDIAGALAYHEMLAGLAAEYGLPLVDYILEGIWWEADLMYDDVHPNGRGYLLMEENIFHGLEETFQVSGMIR